MNEDEIKGQWKQLHGKLKARWGKLTDDDLTEASGSTEYLAGKLQERYGVARDEAKTRSGISKTLSRNHRHGALHALEAAPRPSKETPPPRRFLTAPGRSRASPEPIPSAFGAGGPVTCQQHGRAYAPGSPWMDLPGDF